MKKYQFHKLADLLPMMNKEYFEDLKRDISENGFDKKRPIILFEGKILDGRNRFKACQELKVSPSFEEYKGNNPVSLVRSLNYNRRDLTSSQRAAVFIELLPYEKEEAEKRKKQNGGKVSQKIDTPLKDKNSGRATQKVAENANSNREYISLAWKLKNQRPELFKQVKEGIKNLSDINKQLRDEKFHNEKLKIKEEAKRIKDNDTGIILGDCLMEIPKLKDNSISCVIIDPPYGIQYKSNYGYIKHNKIKNDDGSIFQLLDKSLDLVKLKLKKDAHIYIFSSWKIIDKIKPIVEKHFQVKNILVWHKKNSGMGNLQGDYSNRYEVVIFGIKGNRKLLGGYRPSNVLEFPTAVSKYSPTQKPIELLKELIQNSTVEGELVLDFVAGSGSTLIAAKELNRKWVGIEIDKRYCDICRVRLSRVLTP